MPTNTLIARLEAASGGDRELDALVAAHFRILSPAAEKERWAREWGGPFEAHGDLVFLMHSNGERGLNYRPGNFTTSIDGALALVERCKPDWVGPINLMMAGSGMAYLEPRDPCAEGVQAFGNTPALALCIALLKALEANRSGEG